MKNLFITIILGSIIVFLGLGQRVFAPAGILPDVISKAPDLFKKAEEKKISLLFLGDIMMDRHIRTVGETRGYDFYFEYAAPVFKNYDFVVANLEGPVTDFSSVSRVQSEEDPNLFKFTMSPKVLSAIKKAGIDVVNISNNHMYDFGKEGIEQTRENILKAGLRYFGDPFEEKYKTLTLEKNGIVFHLLAFNEFFDNSKETISLIEEFSEKGGEVIIFTHWGEEYIPAVQRVKNFARSFVNSGANAVIGSHPHVLQEFEEYGAAPIFYSLGNFIFDQYWMESVKRGGAAEIVIKNNGEIESRLLQVYLDDELRPCISE